jgi:ECF transporter S component (folate family)
MRSQQSRARFVAQVAVLVAVSIVVRRLLTPQVAGLNLGGLPIIVSGLLLGPVGGAYVGALSDVIGYLLAGSGGPYSPLFTCSAALTGALPALLMGLLEPAGGWWVGAPDFSLRKRRSDRWALTLRLGLAIGISQLFTKVLLLPIFFHLLFGWSTQVTRVAYLRIELVHIPLFTVLSMQILRAVLKSRRSTVAPVATPAAASPARLAA